MLICSFIVVKLLENSLHNCILSLNLALFFSQKLSFERTERQKMTTCVVTNWLFART